MIEWLLEIPALLFPASLEAIRVGASRWVNIFVYRLVTGVGTKPLHV